MDYPIEDRPFSQLAERHEGQVPECPAHINGIEITPESPLRVLWAKANMPDDPSWTPEQWLVAQKIKADAAKNLAAFTHPKLAQVEHRGNVKLTHEEALKALE